MKTNTPKGWVNPYDAAAVFELKAIDRIKKKSAEHLLRSEMRFFTDAYHRITEEKMRVERQGTIMEEREESAQVWDWYVKQMQTLQRQISNLMAGYTENQPHGKWLLSITGIDKVLAASLLTYIDIEKADAASSVWAYAGLAPSIKWEKGKPCPWNRRLKSICWNVGESFVKTQNREGSFYGKHYRERRALEDKMNDEGKFKEQAEEILATRNIGKTTDAYKAYSKGFLPKAHIYSRAKRWTVKLFLSHYHYVAWKCLRDGEPPIPYVFSVLGHKDYIDPPNLDILEKD